MPTRDFEAAVRRAVVARHRALAEQLQRFRRDAGISKAALARAAGVDAAYLGRIEDGSENPTFESYQRIAAALGADLFARLYPGTGPAIRDRWQAPILEALHTLLHPRWHPFTEVAVRDPERGWIDAALHDARARTLVASELQSELRRLEQLIRWHAAKAASLPSWDGGPSSARSRRSAGCSSSGARAPREPWRRSSPSSCASPTPPTPTTPSAP